MSPSIRSLTSRLRRGEQVTESAWGLVFEVTSMLGTLLAFTLLGRSLGAEGYGEYASLYAIAGPFITLAGAGVTLSLLQHVVRDGEPLSETARSCLSLTLVLGSLLTIGGAAAAFRVVDSLAVVAIISILLIEFFTTPLVNLAASVRQTETYAGAVRIRILLVLGRSVILVVLFASNNLTVASLGISQLAWSGVLAVLVLRFVGIQYGFRLLPGRVHRRHLKSNVVFSTAITADGIANEGDKVVLADSGYRVDTGLYAAAYRIIGLGMVPIGALVSSSHKRFLENEEGRRREHLDLALKYSAVSGAYGILVGIGIFLTAPVFPMVMGEEFEGSVTILRWLSPIVFLRAVGIFSLNGLMGLGKGGLRTVIIVANAAFGVVLFLTLIPERGWEGAIMATLICEAAQVVMTWTALVACQHRADRTADQAARQQP